MVTCFIQVLLLVVSTLFHGVLAAEYLVGVGKDETTGKKGIGFDPSAIHPVAGDVIVFEFRSGQHSAVQSTFDTPCVGNGGFNSGVQTVSGALAVDAPGLPTVRLTVNDTNPLWFFDEAGGDCSKGGVLAVNPTEAQSAAAFRDNASKAPVPNTSSSSSTSASIPTNSLATTTSTPSSKSHSVRGWNFHVYLVLGGLLLAPIVAFL
ncbi:hypothetical protein M413DRAFT_6999 [Hebeloma cylindrosporum]|uniref:Phytocyanin domain-containing protein n=1 Tax=Hebeloma cylindrosporum TaxID=76867 RepID=A0A0C3CUK5_HEBCY|nr:hypothetical protein M413DRAFT_6999 [Hebeloma cylindrosporum h7]